MKTAFRCAAAALLVGGATGAHGQSALDGFDPNADNRANVVVAQPDGKILIGGYEIALGSVLATAGVFFATLVPAQASSRTELEAAVNQSTQNDGTPEGQQYRNKFEQAILPTLRGRFTPV